MTAQLFIKHIRYSTQQLMGQWFAILSSALVFSLVSLLALATWMNAATNNSLQIPFLPNAFTGKRGSLLVLPILLCAPLVVGLLFRAGAHMPLDLPVAWGCSFQDFQIISALFIAALFVGAVIFMVMGLINPAMIGLRSRLLVMVSFLIASAFPPLFLLVTSYLAPFISQPLTGGNCS